MTFSSDKPDVEYPPTEVTTEMLQNYYDALDHHDWFYDMTDAQATFIAGDAVHMTLILGARVSPEHKKLYDAMKAHKLDLNRKTPKPQRPE